MRITKTTSIHVRFHEVAPYIAGAVIIGLLASLSPYSAITFCAIVVSLLLFDVWQDKARQRKRDKVIAEARVHTDLLDENNYKEHLPPIKRALDLINGK